ncbi:MAG: TatD family hydrolase [Candidatus Marinimicrobia bacterium]|jgi:TatD DNase family protein|nr:TatD family hydrolase [Candidatus Neomarinimicrobiota bacterium]MBT3937983.1 TatD family hydrolase [Candidatus Neomarinimicrobiota bacterium]MBT3961605.1 TatD family hydrolase [Candidatus Neomarinimicrobiota bacterium]MBT4382007.1 TatD family hydrolase [Candidatus Neomarinimicrobiota bacterium]MBT4636138.1 TatD family hydrolase [Candidatus Neomarinimicrobiota bacterium]
MIIDTHCHLFYPDIKNSLESVLSQAEEQGVTQFICVGTNLGDSRECLILSETDIRIFGSAGIHPHDAKDAPIDYIDQITNLMSFDRMVACGEMGLDFFRNHSTPKEQKRIFIEQIELANYLEKPIIFHNRDADKDTIRVLTKYGNGNGVAHCFSSDLKTAEAFLELGYYISFSGNLTFKNSHLPSVAGQVPLERILVETDSPYLSPMPFRGKPNVPGRTRFVAERLALIHETSIEDIAEKTSNNARNLFKLS